MKRKCFYRMSFALLALLLVSGLTVRAAEESAQEEGEKTVKNYRGLQFSVPKDWPIEKVGNTIGPIPIEDYMSRKFAAMEDRLKKQEEKIAALEKKMEIFERRKRLNG